MAERIPPQEATEYPWWAIIDPRKVRADVFSVANAVTGPFFSRAAATEHLEARRYAFGPKAAVYCFSGYASNDWRDFCKEPPPASGTTAPGRSPGSPSDSSEEGAADRPVVGGATLEVRHG